MTEFNFGWTIPLICMEGTPEHWLSKMLVFSIVVAGFRCDYTVIYHYNTKLQGKLVNRGKYCVGDSKLEGVRDASRFAASLFTLIWHSLVLWSELTLHYLHIIRLYAGGEPRETSAWTLGAPFTLLCRNNSFLYFSSICFYHVLLQNIWTWLGSSNLILLRG